MAENEPNEVTVTVFPSPRSVEISWNFPLDTDTPNTVSVYRDTTLLAQFKVDPFVLVDNGPFPKETTEFNYSVCADYDDRSLCAGPLVPTQVPGTAPAPSGGGGSGGGSGGGRQTPPEPATDVFAVAQGWSRVQLTWSNATGCTSINVERFIDGQLFANHWWDGLPDGATELDDQDGLAPGTSYWYQVWKINPAGNTPRNSNIVATPAVPLVAGAHSGWLIQSRFGSWGNYELVVPMGDHLAHYWRDNDAVGYPWHGPTVIPGPYHGPEGKNRFALPIQFTAASLLQSSIGPGNLDVVSVAHITNGDSHLVFYGRDASGWHGPATLDADGQPVTGVTGAPAFIQSTYGAVGNYELVVPMGDHLAHYWRDNDAVGHPWHGPILIQGPYHGPLGKNRFAPPSQFTAASLLQSTIGPGNLDVVSVANTTTGDSHLVFYGRDASGWHGPANLIADGQPVTGVTGAPAFIQGTYGAVGNYELVVPMGDHLAHYWRDNNAPGYPWHGPIVIPGPYHGTEGKNGFALPVQFLGASLIESNLADGRLEVAAVARSSSGTTFLISYIRDVTGWHMTYPVADAHQIAGITVS
jgi:hypothetical protein